MQRGEIIKNKLYQTKKSKIVIELIGGTGNQLFQLLACALLAHNNKRLPYFSDRLLDGDRKLETENIANLLGIKYIDSEEIRNWPLINEENIVHPSYFCSNPEHEFLPNIDLVLSGYFQNYRIHKKDNVESIRECAKDTFNKVHDSEDKYIAIHVRELQASNNKKPLKGIDNIDIQYYIRSLEIIKEDAIKNNIPIKNVYLFTDMFKDKTNSNIIPKIKNYLYKNNFNLIFADNLCSTSWETISIMSQADYLIISCSTFSWWAAYLSNSFVISPILSLWDTRLNTLDNWIQVNDGNFSPKSWHRENIYKEQKIRIKYHKITNIFYRKLKHIFKFYILKRTIYSVYKKNRRLKMKNLLS